MRVLNVVNWLGFGGIETGLLRALPHLQEHGIEVDVCCLGPANVLDDDFERLGCKIWRISKSPNCLKTAGELEQVLKRREYSLVHSRFGYTSGGLALGAARSGVPCVVSIHSSEPLSLYSWRNKPVLSAARRKWLAWHRRLMDRCVDVFIGHSRANITAFEPNWQSYGSRYRVILNGVNIPDRFEENKLQLRASLNLPDDIPVVLHIGSFRKVKNHHGLLKIFREVLKRNPKAQLLLVGDGPLRHEVAEHALALGISNRIRFEGPQEDIWRYYRAADLFLFPSHSEGFGNALVESAAARLPVVASDIPAHRESVARVQQKFLFSLPDYEQAAELAVAQLHAAREGTNTWVKESEFFARTHFPIERFADDIADVYGELAAKAA